MHLELRVIKLENGKWIVECRYCHRGDTDTTWCSEHDSIEHATKKEAVAEMEWWRGQHAMDCAAERRYQSQIAYACGERD